jgi:hypothetical protein
LCGKNNQAETAFLCGKNNLTETVCLAPFQNQFFLVFGMVKTIDILGIDNHPSFTCVGGSWV